MAQMGVATKEQLTYIDQTIYDPKTAPLVALQLFSTIKLNPIQMSYRYKVRSTKAMAQAYANRGTDIPVVDEGFKEYEVPITQSALACEYSWMELQEAQAANVNLLADQAALVARGLAERRDRIIFNGMDIGPNTRIIGLTDTNTDVTGFQQLALDGDHALDKLAQDTEDGALKMRNVLREAVQKITHLIGYANAKPALLMPQKEIDLLDNPVSKLRPDITVRDMVSQYFSSIQAVPELEGQYWHAKNASKADKQKDMAIVCLTDKDIAQIPVAMEMTQLQQEYHDGVTKIPYVERHGGLAVRYPSAFVQITGINTPTANQLKEGNYEH